MLLSGNALLCCCPSMAVSNFIEELQRESHATVSGCLILGSAIPPSPATITVPLSKSLPACSSYYGCITNLLKTQGIKQPFNVFMYFVDGEFLGYRRVGDVRGSTQLGDLKSWGLESSRRLLHTHIGRCCLLARNELRCQLELPKAWPLGFFTEKSVEGVRRPTPCLPLNLGNHSATSSTLCWQGSYNLCQIEGGGQRSTLLMEVCSWHTQSRVHRTGCVLVYRPGKRNLPRCTSGSLDDLLFLKSH